MKVDNRTMEQILQAEIDRCHKLVEKRLENPKAWDGTVAALMIRDIKMGEKAIEDKDATGMFHALRSLRENNIYLNQY